MYYITNTLDTGDLLQRLDEESGVPYYLQVVKQVQRMIASGAIAPGDQLPTVRDMASDLVLNPNTIAKAYQELEHRGIVETRRGLGTFARAPKTPVSDADRRSTISKLLNEVLLEAQGMGVELDDVRALLDQLIEEKYEQRIVA